MTKKKSIKETIITGAPVPTIAAAYISNLARFLLSRKLHIAVNF